MLLSSVQVVSVEALLLLVVVGLAGGVVEEEDPE